MEIFELKKKLKIAINAQIPSASGAGGIETVLRVLASLNRLEGDEEYIFIGHWQDADWLKALLGERQKLVRAPGPITSLPQKFKKLKSVLQPLLPAARRVKDFLRSAPVDGLSVSDGFYESLGCDVIHFPYQDFVMTKIPAVYNPHDLQHLHYPQFFPPEEIRRREIVYPAACRAARTIVAASNFVKDDIIESYKIDKSKIQVVPWSPPDMAGSDYGETETKAIFEKYQLPPPHTFALYPAMTWEHKNHLRLIEAVALLRDLYGIRINIVCTGHQNSFFPQIERRLYDLDLADQITFTGIVKPAELSRLYSLTQFVIIPTLFEAASGPLFEAWQHGVAVACSAVTSLPEQAADAALLFDPVSVGEIAGALKKLAADEELRADLRIRGFRRLLDFAPEQTAKGYRAVYRKTAGSELSEEDRRFLE